jgi:two-component system sensor histidine kinase KdpD
MALAGFFREGNLSALRELVLRRLANVVEDDLESYMRAEEIDEPWPACAGVAVVADDSQGFGVVLRRAWRNATAMNAPLVVVWAEPRSWGRSSPEQRARLEENLRLAEDLGAEVVRRRDVDEADAVLETVRDRNLEAVFVRSSRLPAWRRLRGERTLGERLLDRREAVDVHLVRAEAVSDR